MKNNSKKLLFLLYPAHGEPAWFAVERLRWLFPNLTDSGYRSLLFLLQKKELLHVDRLAVEGKEPDLVVRLSPHGQEAVSGQFPVLQSLERINASGKLIIFLQAPQSDKNFRYLRQLLSRQQLVALSRGVFYALGELDPLLLRELKQSYKNAVVVLSIGQWLVGDAYRIIGRKIALQDQFDLYSGVSTELDRLISLLPVTKEFSDQQKKQFLMAFTRLLSFLADSSPFFFYYSPQVRPLLNLLSQCQIPFKI